MPITCGVGRTPIENVAKIEINKVLDKALLLPSLSPILPKKRAPTGRVKYPPANIPKVIKYDIYVFSMEKKNFTNLRS